MTRVHQSDFFNLGTVLHCNADRIDPVCRSIKLERDSRDAFALTLRGLELR
jgi:hypothetical protein